MELAIINGTYRDSKESRNAQQAAVNAAAAAQMVSPNNQALPLSAHLRAATHTPLGFYGFLKHKNIMMDSLHSSSPYLGQLEQGSHFLNFDGITGAPLIISPHHHHHRLQNGLNGVGGGQGQHPQLQLGGGPTTVGDSLLYAAASPYTAQDYATYLQLAEYPPEHGGLFAR
jgi:hypothetical protein